MMDAFATKSRDIVRQLCQDDGVSGEHTSDWGMKNEATTDWRMIYRIETVFHRLPQEARAYNGGSPSSCLEET